MKKKKYLILMLVSGVLVLYAIFSIAYHFKDNWQTRQIQSTFKEDIQSNIQMINPPEDDNDSYWDYIDTDFLQVDFTDLIKQNPDTVAWIQMAGTKIDYPVVQTDNNTYYLTHNYDKSSSKGGWIFMDFRNNSKNWDRNTVIYGHRRLDDSMFGSMRFALEESWLKNPPIIKLSTPNENLIWQIFSVYSIFEESYYITTHFESDESFANFLTTIKKRSIYNFNTTPSLTDKILTLSSCKDNLGNRIVVHAKLIKKETR